MNELAQFPSQRRSPLLRLGLRRHLRALCATKPSCQTLYAMQLASGVPVEREPGICPVCGSATCGLARNLARRS
jgi:hypothetical protein